MSQTLTAMDYKEIGGTVLYCDEGGKPVGASRSNACIRHCTAYRTFTDIKDLPYLRKQPRSWNTGMSGRYGHLAYAFMFTSMDIWRMFTFGL